MIIDYLVNNAKYEMCSYIAKNPKENKKMDII